MGLRVLTVQTAAGTALTNSTTETALLSQTFAANFWQPGKVVQFEGLVQVTAQNSTDTVTCKLYFGGTTLTTEIAASSAVDSVVGDLFHARGTLACRGVGTASTFVCTVQLNDPDVEGTAIGAHFEIETAIDTTAATYLEVAGTWSVANAGNSCAGELWNVFEIVTDI